MVQIEKINLSNAKLCTHGDKIIWKNYEIETFESPGHSSDSMMYIIKNAKAVICGDTIFKGSIGRTDFPNGDQHKIIESINKLFEKIDDAYVLYPGHGPKTTVGFEKKHNPFLND